MIEIVITRKNRLEPTLILQSVNDVTNCKRNKKEKHFFLVVIKYAQLIQPTLNPGIKFCNDFRIRDQSLRLKCGISWQKIRPWRKKDTTCLWMLRFICIMILKPEGNFRAGNSTSLIICIMYGEVATKLYFQLLLLLPSRDTSICHFALTAWDEEKVKYRGLKNLSHCHKTTVLKGNVHCIVALGP